MLRCCGEAPDSKFDHISRDTKMTEMTKEEMREQIARAMSEFKGTVKRNNHVGGKSLLNKRSANCRAAKRHLSIAL